MTEAGWTRNAPTKEGWYWWKRTENDNPVIVWVNAFHPDKQLRAEMISGRRELLTHFTGLFNGPITPDSYQQGRVAANVDALVDRFLAWPLPASVCSDLCATKQGYPHRSGTNLLSAAEARAMLEYVLGIESLAQQAQGGVEE